MSSPTLAFVSRRDVAAPPGMERVFCAYRIPFLPAPLPPRAGAEQQATELAREMLRAQAFLISALARWQGQAVALRYRFRPETGAVEIGLLVRAMAPQGYAVAQAGALASEVTQRLAAVGVATEPITAPEEVFGLLMPAGHSYIAEVRQHEEVVQLQAGGAYTVSPLRPLFSTWQSVFELVARQPAPYVISIHLEPSQLFPGEQSVFSEAAALGHVLKDFRFSGYSTVEHVDPLAGVVGELYADYLRRLSAPFLTVVQVASPDYQAVQAITSALAAEMSERVEVRAALAKGTLPAGAQVMIPRSMNDAALAQLTLTLLELQPWGDMATRAEQRRLPFLMDAETAAAAFRFPVAVDGRIPGVATRMVTPGAGGRPIGKIFLSYRRGDSAGITGRVFDRLAARYGKDAIFLDVSSLPLGVDFMEHIRRAIQESAVQLALMGPGWLDAVDAAGNRRLEAENDPVRREVEVGLDSRATVIPVLLDGITMPAGERLPGSLPRLCALNSCPVRHADFDHDMERLIDAIDARLIGGAGAVS